MGMEAVAGDAFNRRMLSHPSRCGSQRSMTMASGASVTAVASAS
jgi:hypothetical protein